jgi:hypothetical protein
MLPLQLHKLVQMMNQRNFKHQRSRSHCALIPGLSWSNLEGYYQMTQSTDILNGF